MALGRQEKQPCLPLSRKRQEAIANGEDPAQVLCMLHGISGLCDEHHCTGEMLTTPSTKKTYKKHGQQRVGNFLDTLRKHQEIVSQAQPAETQKQATS